MAERKSAADHEVRLPPSASILEVALTTATTAATAPVPPAGSSSSTSANTASSITTPAPTFTTTTTTTPPPGTGSTTTTSSSSQRITRSSARQAASQAAQASTTPAAPASTRGATIASVSSTDTTPLSRKRKTSDTSPPTVTHSHSTGRRSKRQKVSETVTSSPHPIISPTRSNSRRKGKAPVTMESVDNPASSARSAETTSHPSNSNRKSARNKKTTSHSQEESTIPSSPLSRRPARYLGHLADEDTTMSGTEDKREIESPSPATGGAIHENERRGHDHDDDDDDDEEEDEDDDGGNDGDGDRDNIDDIAGHQRYDSVADEGEEDEDEDDDDDDPFSGFGSHGGPESSLSNTLRALTGMMSSLSGRLRELLHNLRNDDSSVQLIALQELSEILLVSTEDNLSGHFSPDAFVKELVVLMTKEESPEIMLLACRCLANLMEALPASVANVVYGNAVPILCQKLLEISFIDLAEQALSTLEKISAEYPTSIVREGGLTACLSYLDFFATSTQRTAVTTAANCCRNIPDDSFPVVRDVMPILLNVLSSSDQRVVEQASLCVSGIVESFKYHPSKLEELVSIDLLRAVLRLLVPGTTNLIGPNIHTQFLRVLAHSARASPRLASGLFKLNVVETLYQILTGVSPPSGTEDVASKLDSVVIMQALIHRPREQIVEALNVICELLPDLPRKADSATGDLMDFQTTVEHITSSHLNARSRQDLNDNRLKLLEDCKYEVRRFALIIFPTLTDAFSSTINLSVRQKVLNAQLKMLSNLDEDILTEALTPVPYASFLASILSQQDHPSLVMLGLQATELLIGRLDSIYRYQLYREGVILEIHKLAADDDSTEPPQDSSATQAKEHSHRSGDHSERNPHSSKGSLDGHNHDEDGTVDAEEDEGEDEDDAGQTHQVLHHENEEHEEEDDEEENEHELNPSDISPASSRESSMSLDATTSQRFVSNTQSMKTRIRNVAKRFLEIHEKEDHCQVMKQRATEILQSLSDLAGELDAFYLTRTSPDLSSRNGKELFLKLASYFDTDILESVTSAELLASGMVRVLLAVFTNPDKALARDAQATFLEVFMSYTVKSKPKTATAESPATPFSVMIHKLQDLLSRSEHFEVITVHHNSFDGNRSSAASMLGKQIRLRLVADDESAIPRSYRNIMVSIHAIATFKSLDDYLRPRINLAGRPRGSRRDGLSRALAAIAGSGILPPGSAAAAHLAERSHFLGTAPPPPPPPPPPASFTPNASRFVRRFNNRHSQQTADAVPSDQSGGPSSTDKGPSRRSSRHQSSSADASNRRHPPDQDEAPQNTLECADEKQLMDEDDVGEGSALDTIVGDLDEDMDDGDTLDPSAVSLEVANGGKIMARKDDGTRVSTPAGSSLGQRQLSDSLISGHTTPTSSHSASRHMSYASALQSVPQDWHIEFSMNDKVIPHEITIYRALHSSPPLVEDHLNRSIWSTTHTIKFRRVSGQPSTESKTNIPIPEAEGESEGRFPASLAKHPSTASILQLLDILHELNANIEDVLIEKRNNVVGLHVEPLSQFVNTKLTAKLNRQLEEPLVVASSCLPSWSEDLARLYPFLFPFETRHLFLQSTSFGYARSMARWQNAQSGEETRRDRNNERPFLGRLQRQKVRISRTKILESALKVMDLYGASQSILEVEYFEEVGTGLGPTLEFYSTVSLEFSKKKLKLWREVDSSGSDDFVTGQSGLFPRPLKQEEVTAPNGERILQLFKILGKFVARSMIDSRIIDIHFNPIFFRIGDTKTGVKPSLGAVKIVDPGLAQSLKTIKKFALAKKEIDEDHARSPAQKVADTERIVVDNVRLEDLCLDFTLPGYPDIELEDGGSHKRVTIENVDTYLEKVIDMTLGSGVRRQIDAFRAGFSLVFPYSALRAFTPDELVSLFGKVEEDWSLETLMDSIKADHGYNMDSRSVKNLLQTMSNLSPKQRRNFLQFTTGSPKLPIGGFKSLTPMFTVVCKPSEPPYTSDDYLPSVMTCVNYLKLPDYTTLDILKKQLFVAIKEGQGAFHLS